MKTVVITGGTDGIGRALAQTYLERGDQVAVVGTSQAKGDDFLAAATELGAQGRAWFLPADLGLIDENTRLIDRLSAQFESLDVLVLAARYHRSARVETPDGFEANFALFYLSRYLLSHGLVSPLSRSGSAVILNFGAAGLAGPPRWEDLQLSRQYHGVAAMGHAGSLNDLLAVDFVDRYPDPNIRYVINHPGVVSTSFAGEYDLAPQTAAQVEQLRLTGKTINTAVKHILPFLDSAGQARLTAVYEGAVVPLYPETSSLADARRLHDITRQLVEGHLARTGNHAREIQG
jgi:NAD(P)-dependent dehydrogenase (short-subunit alcohol dehydrogenase family)